MKRLAAIVGASLFALGATAHAEPPQLNYKPAPELTSFFTKAFGDKLKVIGDPQIMAPGQSIHLFNFFSLRPVVSVPVAFQRTARLDQDVVIAFQSNQKDPLILHKGTMLYHAVFKRDAAAESRPIEAWCGVTSWHMWGSDHYTSQCLVKTPDGKAVAYNGDTWHDYDDRFTMENTKGGVHAPHWFAFGLNDNPSLPVDYPAITETDLPSPDMAVVLRFDRPIKDKAGNVTLLATWALRGPDGDIPTTGPLVAFEIPVKDGHIHIAMLDHELDAAYAEDDKALSSLAIANYNAPVIQIKPSADLSPAKITSEIVDEPWLFGSMMIDPKSVTISQTPLAVGDIFLSGSGHLGPRFRLKASANVNFDYYYAGTPLYRAEYTGYEANGEKYKISYWCGPGETHALIHFKFVLCTPSTPEGGRGTYFVRNWELIGFMKNRQTPVDFVPLDAAPDPDPAPETRSFQMRVTEISASKIGLKLGLLTDDHFTMQERYEIPLDDTGKARLYLWDRIVEFSRDQGQVSAKILPGTGQGPRYGKIFVEDGGY